MHNVVLQLIQPSLRSLGQKFSMPGLADCSRNSEQKFPVAPNKRYKHDLWSHNTQLYFLCQTNIYLSQSKVVQALTHEIRNREMLGLNHGPYTERYEVIRGFLQSFLVGITGLLSLPSPSFHNIFRQSSHTYYLTELVIDSVFK